MIEEDFLSEMFYQCIHDSSDEEIRELIQLLNTFEEDFALTFLVSQILKDLEENTIDLTGNGLKKEPKKIFDEVRKKYPNND